MSAQGEGAQELERHVLELFQLVCDALAGATHALLYAEADTARQIVDGDKAIDSLTEEITAVVWQQIEASTPTQRQLRQLVSLLLILPELERSGDLAQNIARGATRDLGLELSARCSGFIQRMAEVALEMWHGVALAYASKSAVGVAIDESDEEIDILHARLTEEIESGSMSSATASDVTLIARYYERLGDHAVNLARRIGGLSAP